MNLSELSDLLIDVVDVVLCITNSYGHMKTGLWFKVSSERLEAKYTMAYDASSHKR